MNINPPIFSNEEKHCLSCIHLDEKLDGTFICNLYMAKPNIDFNCNSFSPRIYWLYKQFDEEIRSK